MKISQVQKVSIYELSAARRNQMLQVAAPYYRDPSSGLDDELGWGNWVYFVEGDDATIGCFLIVDFDHHSTTLNGRPYRFTYLGLGCATKCPIMLVFQQVKRDFSRCLANGTAGVLHLTTRTPFAYRSIVRAFGKNVFPTNFDRQPAESMQIAKHIRASIHHKPLFSEQENPFVLRQVKKGPFTSQEVARIDGFREETPLSKLNIACDGTDELIVFHTFVT